ncbi:MAG: M67 family metallopeptidase [Elusimicrobia bacterium]|nr:M67 family metallopeptidase [Elusimicrobiota bacterium]
MPRKLIFDRKEWNKLKNLCEEGYPKEVCGLLFGTMLDQKTAKVTKLEPLENILDEKHSARLKELMAAGVVTLPKERIFKGGSYEFLIDPKEHFSKIALAEKEGLEQVGLFHSHPDHPAKPSAIDASQPYLAGWSNLIVAVNQRQFKEACSWFREKEDSPFQPEEILVE